MMIPAIESRINIAPTIGRSPTIIKMPAKNISTDDKYPNQALPMFSFLEIEFTEIFANGPTQMTLIAYD